MKPRRALITIQWSDDGSDGRQLVDMTIGHVERSSLWHGLRRTCEGYSFTIGGDSTVIGPPPEWWKAGDDSPDDILPAVTLCLARPVFRISGPWTFNLDQP